MKLGCRIFLVILCLLLWTAPAVAGLDEEVAAAVAARNRHDYPTANRILTKLIRQGQKPKQALSSLHAMRGVFWQEQGEYYRAIADFTISTQHNPDHGEAYNNLAWILATCSDPDFRNGALAVKNALKAVELLKNSPESLDTLAAAYAEAGRFAEAVQTMERVVAWCQERGDTARLELARQHLNAYKQNQPWREYPRKP